MSQPHRIRLRDPWQVRSDGTASIHTRSFGMPRKNSETEQIWLVIQGAVPSSVIHLNGINLGIITFELQRFLITQQLTNRNKLEILGPTRGEVWLEIEEKDGKVMESTKDSPVTE